MALLTILRSWNISGWTEFNSLDRLIFTMKTFCNHLNPGEEEKGVGPMGRPTNWVGVPGFGLASCRRWGILASFLEVVEPSHLCFPMVAGRTYSNTPAIASTSACISARAAVEANDSTPSDQSQIQHSAADFGSSLSMTASFRVIQLQEFYWPLM